jgi:hypothetical protein
MRIKRLLIRQHSKSRLENKVLFAAWRVCGIVILRIAEATTAAGGLRERPSGRRRLPVAKDCHAIDRFPIM